MKTLSLALVGMLFCLGCESSSSSNSNVAIHQQTEDLKPEIQQLEEELTPLLREQRSRIWSESMKNIAATAEELAAQAEFGLGPIWADVLPHQEPLLLDAYDAKKDIRRLRSTMLAQEQKAPGGIVYFGNIDLIAEKRWMESWAADLKEGTRSDYLNYWSRVTSYTNFIESAGLTTDEANVFAQKARAEAIKTIPVRLQQWSTGELRSNPRDEVEVWCYRLLLNENDLGLTKRELLQMIEQGEKIERDRLLASWKTSLQEFYDTQDPAHLRFVQNKDVTGADLEITDKELQRLREVFRQTID